MRKIIVIVLIFLLHACGVEQSRSEAMVDYEQARTIFWKHLYPDNGETLYCRQKFVVGERQGLNVEHVFPMSWVTNSLGCGTRKQCRRTSKLFNQIEADLHNLYPAKAKVNYARSSFRFGDVKGESRRFGSQCDFEVSDKHRVAEPTPEARGDIARAMFFMAHKYRKHGLVIYAKQQALLKIWNAEDNPSLNEVHRNNSIERMQGDRNQFIDNPSLVDQYFQ